MIRKYEKSGDRYKAQSVEELKEQKWRFTTLLRINPHAQKRLC
jgi:hypothetical protein